MTDATELEAVALEEEIAAPPKKKFDRSITEGPLARAVWKIAWPTILANVVAGMQNVVDQVLVGNLVGYKANAALGVSNQIFILVVVFISSIFIGMSVLVARFAGAHNSEKVNRTVYQAFLAAVIISVFIIAPLGYFGAPYLLDLINAEAGVKAEALPYLRISFAFSIGLLLYFMTSGALRAGGDARTPMALGLVMTILNLVLNFILIRGLGPIPAFGTMGSAMGTAIATCTVGLYAVYSMWSGRWVVGFPRGGGWGPDWGVIRSLFKFGLPSGIQGIAANIGGFLMYGFIGSVHNGAAAQAAFAICYSQLFSLITWGSNALMGSTAAVVGQNLGAKHVDRAFAAANTSGRIAMGGAAALGFIYFFFPHQLLSVFGIIDTDTLAIGSELLRVLAFSGLFISVALAYTGALQGSGDTKSPLYISIISQVVVPVGLCFIIKTFGTLQPLHIWLAVLAGHMTRCGLSVIRFLQGKWRTIAVDISTTHG